MTWYRYLLPRLLHPKINRSSRQHCVEISSTNSFQPHIDIFNPRPPIIFLILIQQENHYCQPVYFHSQDSNYCVAKDSANELQPRHFDQNELHPPHRHGYPPNHPAERSCHKISDEKPIGYIFQVCCQSNRAPFLQGLPDTRFNTLGFPIVNA